MVAILTTVLPAQSRQPTISAVAAERVPADRAASVGVDVVATIADRLHPIPHDGGRTSLLLDERSRQALAELRQRGLSDGNLAATLFPHVTVMVLRLSDDMAMAGNSGGGDRQPVIAGVVQAVHDIVGAKEVPYLKILADQIVAASGFDGEAAPSAILMSDIALEVQQRCAALFAGLGHRPAYALGLDTGSAIGSPVGFDTVAYNLWGEAVRVAETMAVTARPGSIQATETTCDLVSEKFLLRKRGGFYMERFGEMTTYALRARL
jgi:adenylate cyclase